MYISSDGTVKDPKGLNTEYLINALAKCSREIFNSKNEEEYNKYLANIDVLYAELQARFSKYLIDRIDMEWK